MGEWGIFCEGNLLRFHNSFIAISCESTRVSTESVLKLWRAKDPTDSAEVYTQVRFFNFFFPTFSVFLEVVFFHQPTRQPFPPCSECKDFHAALKASA